MARSGIGHALRMAFAAASLACFGTATAQADAAWDKVIADARAEGKVVFYTAHTGDPVTKQVAAAFTARYGIPVDIFEARGPELRERTRVEQMTGRFLADLTYTSATQTKVMEKEEKNMFTRHEPGPNAQRLRKPFTDDGLFAPVMTITYGILVNSNLVKPGEEPKSWKDLVDPKWKGKILSDDVRAVGGGYLMFYLTYDLFGEEWHRQLAAQGLVFSRDYRESPKRIARGEYAMYIPFTLSDILQLKGLPLRYTVPVEGAPYVTYGAVVNTGAPHPNAARLYLDFMESEESQLIHAKAGFGVVIDGVAEKAPAEAQALANTKLAGATEADRQDDMIARAIRIYGK